MDGTLLDYDLVHPVLVVHFYDLVHPVWVVHTCSNAIDNPVHVHGCGTRAPIWLPLPADGLPSPGKKIRTQACASFEVPGRELECCGLKFPVTVKNCGDFFAYRLRSTKGCDLAYCTKGTYSNTRSNE
ncbi:Hypothetical predicted protein [Mytilus galloprovincialis]|uniref:Uncharacterized protein n=1 Tax=Mytilus galloprovincialis TaxID=29158 RepID=A0A8B6GFB1_MYTGA|nr:Hypothetical predicted protein [Mytilus galloprovincialis]